MDTSAELGGFWAKERGGSRAVCLVSGPQVDAVWRSVQDILLDRPEAWQNEYTIEELRAGIVSGEFQLWIGGPSSGPEGILIGIDIAAITQLGGLPDTNEGYLFVHVLAGRGLESYRFWFDVVEWWGTQQGVCELRGLVGPGMERMLARFGFERSKVIVRRPLAGSERIVN